MRIPGKTMDDHLADVARQLPHGSFVDMQDVECNASIYPSQVFLAFRNGFDRDNPHRPYMHIVGECRGLRKSDNAPFYGDVDELSFDEDKGIPVDIFYEFTDAELSRMVGLGMYRRGFECPSIIRESELEMPVYCEIRVVEPQSEDDVPVLFANIEDRHTIETSEAECGYTFGDYFEQAQAHEDEFEDTFDEFGDYDELAHEDLFGDDEHRFEDEAEQEHAPELTPQELAVEQHYENIRERVEERHLRNVPHKELKPREHQAEAEEADDTFVAHEVAKDVVTDAPSFDERMDSADAQKPSEGISEPESDTAVEAEADTDETIHDFDDDDVAEGSADEEDVNRQLTQAGKKAVKRNAVEDNIEANAEDDREAGFDGVDGMDAGDTDEEKGASNPEESRTPRVIPSRIADVADKAVKQGQDDQQYDE